MSRLPTRASVTGTTLSGANLKAVLTAVWDALNGKGLSDVARNNITASATLSAAQAGLVPVDCSTGSVVLTLPVSGAAADDVVFDIRRVDSTAANSLTVLRGGSDTVEGGTTAVLVPPGGSTKLQMPSGATNWRILRLSGGTAQGARNNVSASDSPFRNVVINADMSVDQRNGGGAQTFTAAAALAYCVDRFYGFCTGANVSGQQITLTDKTKRYRFTGAASVSGIGLGHRIESANSARLAGRVCTLSTKLANSLLGTVTWNAYYANSNDAFGTLASPTRTAIASGSFAVIATEVTYSAQVNVPAAASTGIELVLSVGAQVSGTWQIGDVQLEPGVIPPDAITFERVDAATNRMRCQWYGEPLQGGGNARLFRWYGPGSAGEIRSPFPFQTMKRATPTILNATADFASNCSATIGDVTTYGYNVTMLSSALGTGSFGWLTTTAYADCEL